MHMFVTYVMTVLCGPTKNGSPVLETTYVMQPGKKSLLNNSRAPDELVKAKPEWGLDFMPNARVF